MACRPTRTVRRVAPDGQGISAALGARAPGDAVEVRRTTTGSPPPAPERPVARQSGPPVQPRHFWPDPTTVWGRPCGGADGPLRLNHGPGKSQLTGRKLLTKP